MGYFRLFYYIAYIFNTICRIIKRHGKQILWVVCIFGFLLFCMWPSRSSAYSGIDYSYGDSNYAVFSRYDGVCIDFLRRVDYVYKSNPTASTYLDTIKNLIIQGNNFYIYYSPTTTNDYGASMVEGFSTKSQFLWIVTYRDAVTRTSTAYENYEGIDTNIDRFYLSSSNDYCKTMRLQSNPGFIGATSPVNVEVGVSYYVPRLLFNYINPYVYEYFINGKSLEEIEQLYEINSKLDIITDDTVSTETEEETQEVIEDSQDVFDNQYSSDYNGYNNTLLNTILTPIATYYDGTTIRKITFTLPFVDQSFQLRGDAISSHIRNTTIYTYVQLFWWVTFSIPIFLLLRRIVLWLGTGEFINKPSKFALYMSDFVSKNITPGMM